MGAPSILKVMVGASWFNPAGGAAGMAGVAGAAGAVAFLRVFFRGRALFLRRAFFAGRLVAGLRRTAFFFFFFAIFQPFGADGGIGQGDFNSSGRRVAIKKGRTPHLVTD
jgi:hypothetical protein